MFTTRWRWVAGVALALPRFRGGKKVPPQLARMEAEDLVAAVFPDQMACGENIVGDREVPDHPLTNQTIADCLHEAMDIEGLERLLARIEAGDIRVVARDLTQPSPLALEVLSARPYAYLDDAPLEERRTQAVMARRWLAPESAADLGRLDPEAIARVRLEAWPDPANAEELHDALLWLGCLSADEVQAVPEWAGWLAALARDGRVTQCRDAVGRRGTGGAVPVAVGRQRSAGRNRARPAGRSGTGHAGRARRTARPGRRTISPPRWRRWRSKASPCAAASRPAATPRNGATGGCSRASTTTRSAACAPRSSRSPRATSCASCSPGSA